MNEQEWLVCTDPMLMLRFLQDKEDERRQRLFECACCRRVWHDLVDDRSRQAVAAAEEYADGRMADDVLESIAAAASEAWPHTEEQFPPRGHLSIAAAAYNVAIPMGWWGGAPAFMPPNVIIREFVTNSDAEGAKQCFLLRDIYGNPFRPNTIDPRWLTSTVVDLATAIYDERAFDRMPILGDALMDAGCDNEEIIAHCRSEAEHVRGCWVVDLVLNKI
jgi:hypothetical protein